MQIGYSSRPVHFGAIRLMVNPYANPLNSKEVDAIVKANDKVARVVSVKHAGDNAPPSYYWVTGNDFIRSDDDIKKTITERQEIQRPDTIIF